MDKYTGKVKYLNKEHGFGYISLCEDPGREHGDINFSTSDPGCHSLSLGDIVTFDIRKGNSINKNGKICEYAVSVQLNESVSRPMTSYYQHKTDEESKQANKDLCFLMIEFACRSGIDLSHYEIIFVDKDNLRTCVYTMTLDKLQQLIETGYKHGNKYVPLGEYPNTPKYKENCTMRYLLPVDAFEKLPVAK